MFISKDANLLLSIVNTCLRDKYSSLDELCCEEDVKKEEIESILKEAGFIYNKEINQFR